MIASTPSTVYVVTYPSGAISSVYTTEEAALIDIGAGKDGRYVQPWVLRDGITVGRLGSVQL